MKTVVATEYHPLANAQIKRFIATMMTRLWKFCCRMLHELEEVPYSPHTRVYRTCLPNQRSVRIQPDDHVNTAYSHCHSPRNTTRPQQNSLILLLLNASNPQSGPTKTDGGQKLQKGTDKIRMYYDKHVCYEPHLAAGDYVSVDLPPPTASATN